MRHSTRTLRAAIGIAALLFVTAVPANAGGWETGVPYSAGPGCDINQNGIHDYYHNPETPFEYHLAGKVAGDVLSGKYVQRYDNVVLQRGGYPDGVTYDHEALPEILWNGKLELQGDLQFGDFADLGTLVPLSEMVGLKWSYTFTTLDGEFLAVSSGSFDVDLSTGAILNENIYGPCWEP